MPFVPDWLKAPDFGALYAHGLSTGAGAAEARDRLAASERQNAMEAASRAEQIKSRAALEQAQLQTQKAYHDQQLSLRRERLGQLQQQEQLHAQRIAQLQDQDDLKMRQAAGLLSDQQGFARDVQGGMPTREAIAKYPRLATPANVLSMDRSSQAAANAAQAAADRKRSLQMQQEGLDIRRQGGGLTGTFHLPATPENSYQSPGSVSGNLNQLQTRFGTNLPVVLRPGAPGTTATGPGMAAGAPVGEAGPAIPPGAMQAIAEPRTVEEVKALGRNVRYRNPSDGQIYRTPP